MTDDFFTLLAGVGIQAVVAGDAVRVVLHLDVFASAQGLVAVLAVEPVTHDVFLWLISCKTENSQAQFSIRYQQEDSAGRGRRRRWRSEISKTERESRKKGGRQFLDIQLRNKDQQERQKWEKKNILEPISRYSKTLYSALKAQGSTGQQTLQAVVER